MAAGEQNLQQIQEALAELYDSEAALFDDISLHEEFDYLPPESIRYVRALEKRFQKTVIPTEFVFSSPEQAVAAAKVLFSPIAERVRQQNRAVIPEMIHVYYDRCPGL